MRLPPCRSTRRCYRVPAARVCRGPPHRTTPVSLTRYVVSVNPAIHGKPEKWRSEFAEGWETRRLTLPEILDIITSGQAVIFSGMSSDYRSSSAFAGSQLAAVDVDHGMPIDALGGSSLSPHIAAVYTTSSHQKVTRSNPDGEDRFRVIFILPRPIGDSAIYQKVTTLLISALGGDSACSDPCRVFYGNADAQVDLRPEAQPLGEDWIQRARAAIEDDKRRMAEAAASLDEKDLLQAVYVLEEVLPPTEDGQRDLFIRVTQAVASVGEALFPAWSDWAARGHHGSGRNARQCSERFFRKCRGDRTSLNTLFYLAHQHNPEWRSGLPVEARKSSEDRAVNTGAAVGYSAEDFTGDDEEDYEPSFSSAASSGSYTLIDQGEPAGPTESKKKKAKAPETAGALAALRAAVLAAFPGLRMNLSSYRPEYVGPNGLPRQVEQDSAYLKVGMLLEGQPVLAKGTIYDLATEVANENPYHPVRDYLERCEQGPAVTPEVLSTLATRVLGVPEPGTKENPLMAHGQSYADAVIERFLIGACARAFRPGCEHPWMPVLVGGQGVGKTSFLQGLTPPQADGTFSLAPVVQNGLSRLRDRPHILHAGWIVLLDEFERHCDATSTEVLKNLVSSGVDLSDRKYEHERQFPRSFVLAGAANKRTFLRDPTGNRRFKPIRVTGVVDRGTMRQVDLEWLHANRDHIWAAAMLAFRSSKTHTFSGVEEIAISSAIDFFATQSPIDGAAENAIAKVATTNKDGFLEVVMPEVVTELDMSLDVASRNAPAIEDAIARRGFERTLADGGRFIWRETPAAREDRKQRQSRAALYGMAPPAEAFAPSKYEEAL